MNDLRSEFLVHMYDQMLNDINRHIMVVWQSVGALIGAFSILALAEKGIVSLDVGVALIVLIAGWLGAHLLDASYWYNRNLVIIANIERQFLERADLRRVHYYFGAHRPENRMIMHLKIQVALGIGIVLLVLGYHASMRVVPGLSSPWSAFEFARALPYVAVILSIGYLDWLAKNRDAAYQEFLKNSPGDTVDTADIEYGLGHGHDPKPRR